MPDKPFFIKMKKKRKHRERLEDTSKLFLKVSAYVGFGSLALGLFSWFFMGVSQPVPLIFIGFALFNVLNSYLLRRNKNLNLVYHSIALSSLVVILWISVYSGGLQSPFLFMLGLLVLAGYIINRNFGHLYLGLSLLAIIILAAGAPPDLLPSDT